MDLSTVEQRLRTGKYASAYEFAGDVRKIWSNSFAYNQQGSEIYRATVELSGCFEEWLRGNEGLLFTSRSDAIEELYKQVETLKREIKDLKGKKGRVVAAKQMTWEEKRILGQQIRTLQPQYIRGVVGILKGTLPSAGKGTEFEFDLDMLPVKTCRELQYYVNQCHSLPKPADVDSKLEDLTKAVSDSSSSDSSDLQAIPLVEDIFEPTDFPLIWPQKTNGGEHDDAFIMDLPYASAWCLARETLVVHLELRSVG